MNKIIVLFIVSLFALNIFGQTSYSELSEADKKAYDASSTEWVKNLYAFGVEHKGDTIVLNDEARLILKDSVYHNFIYPKQYTWQYTKAILELKALKPAFWHLINLYANDPKNKDLVLKMIIPFDQIMEMDRIMISTFYSYIAFDPEVATVENGIIKAINRPDISEKKLLAVKEIVEHIHFYRTKKEEGKK
jgi:hypothetical protein